MIDIDGHIIPAEHPCMSCRNLNSSSSLFCLGSPFDRAFSRGGHLFLRDREVEDESDSQRPPILYAHPSTLNIKDMY